MDKRQPAKTPPKESRGWQRCEHEHENKQDQLPFDLPNERPPAPDESSDERHRSYESACQFHSRMRNMPTRKIDPADCPTRENQAGKGGWRNDPFPMRGRRLQFAG